MLASALDILVLFCLLLCLLLCLDACGNDVSGMCGNDVITCSFRSNARFDQMLVSFCFGGSAGTNPGQLLNPKGLVFDKKSGNVIIADSGNHRIQVATCAPVWSHQNSVFFSLKCFWKAFNHVYASR
jgi:hypothetical protein